MTRSTHSGADAIVSALLDHGVTACFGLPGAQLYPLFDSLGRMGGDIELFVPRHEQTAGYMAFGYAKVTGRPGICAVVPGPGVLNAGAALLTAAGCSTPVMCLTGQVPSSYLGRGRGHLHEMPDQRATLRSFVKWAERIDRPADGPAIMEAAFARMLGGRPGPVAIEMCWDRMADVAAFDIAGTRKAQLLPVPDPDAVSRAARLIAGARRPMIMVGSGAMDAAEAVVELAETLNAPTISFRSGRGIVADDHPLGLTAPAGHRLWPDTDLLIGIGTRLELPFMRWGSWFNRIDRLNGVPLIRIDIDPIEHQRIQADVDILADSAQGIAALLAALPKAGFARRGDADAVRRAKADTAIAIDRVQPQMGYLEAIRRVMPRNGIFTEELCQVGFTSNFGFPVYEPRTYLSSGYQGTLGFGFPSALGAKAGHRDRAVVSITGDGGFLFAASELATAAKYGLGVVTIVFNNESYLNFERDQRRLYDGRVLGADLSNPDFVKLAESFGVAARRVTNAAELEKTLERAIADDAPSVIEVKIPSGSESSPWEFLMPAGMGG